MLTKNIPTIIVIFGITGDLVKKKIMPALFSLFINNQLPETFKVVGFSRQDISSKDFEKYLFETSAKYKDANIKNRKAFCKLFSYHPGVFENLADFSDLEKHLRKIDDNWGICANKLFYLAVPPNLYEVIFKNLAASELTRPCSPKEGWTRVLVEKPFGSNLETAEELEKLLSSLFKEVQIYRTDHYLAKEMLQNILAFRFANNLFESNWGRKNIEKVHIRLLEKIGAEDRGSFYDAVGALQDVGQNHLLQMLALVAMEHPAEFSVEAIRKNRADILKTLIVPTEEDVRTSAFRAQYAGYRDVAGVAPNSQTETYFKVRAFLSHPKWKGVPFILESGKRLKDQRKDIEITLRHPIPCLCPRKEHHYKNKLTIGIEPVEGVTIHFGSKKEGMDMELEERTLDFRFRDAEKRTQYTEEYKKLLLDGIAGDQTLFVSSDEVRAMWRFIDPIIYGWRKDLMPLALYEPDTNSVLTDMQIADNSESSRLKKDIGIVGLGKMGAGLARRLLEQGWNVHGIDKDEKVVAALSQEGMKSSSSLKEIVGALASPRKVWLMVPAGKAVDNIIFGKNGLASYLKKGDIVIDGGNSFYKDSQRRAKKLEKFGIHFVDAGVSGGPGGARNGASIMVGGDQKIFKHLEELFQNLSVEDGYIHAGSHGAGHFVKMVHNGIEYGMMQALAEGFDVLRTAELRGLNADKRGKSKLKYKLNLQDIARVYNHGSVVESSLVGWLAKAFEVRGDELGDISGSVGHTGEGEWTVQTARKLGIQAKVIEEAFKFRIKSGKKPSYKGKILSALREQFGGHKTT